MEKEKELSRKTQDAIDAHVKRNPDKAEKIWLDAVKFGTKHKLIVALVKEAIAFGDKQSLYGDFDKAAAKFDLAMSIANSNGAVPPSAMAVLYAKAATNQTNFDEKLAVKNFAIAVESFEAASDRNELEYADCLHQYGRTLARMKALPQSLDVHQKALKAYSKVSTLHPTDLENRIKTLRHLMLGTPELARGAEREELRKKANAMLGLTDLTETPSLKDALSAMHDEGLETSLTLQEAEKLAPERDENESDGCWRLLAALRARFEAHEDWSLRPTDSIIVYPMPFGIEEVQDCFDYFCKRAGEKPWFKVIAASDSIFEPLTVETGDARSIIIDKYGEVSDIVQLINQWLEEKDDRRRFFTLDGAEDEGVYYLMSVDTQERLATKSVLPFIY